jgi:hypothetical protein
VLIYSFVRDPEHFVSKLPQLRQLVEDMAADLRQEAVAMEFGNEFLLTDHNPRGA